MGNKTTNAAPVVWPEREAWGSEPVSSLTHLSERDAFGLAIAWHAELRASVVLTAATGYTADSEPGALSGFYRCVSDYSFMKRLEWIYFDFYRYECNDIGDAVRAARAATVAWFALTCCPGFGKDENPVFWKRVLSTYVRLSPSHEYGAPATAGERFFDGGFPRVCFQWSSRVPLDLLWEPRAQRRRTRHEKTLHRMLRTLKPFILQSRWARGIPVGIGLYKGAHKLADRLKFMDLKHRQREEDPVLNLEIILTYSGSACLEQAIAKYTHARAVVVRNRTQWMQKPHWPRDPAPHIPVDMLTMWWGVNPVDHDMVVAMFASWCSLLPHISTVMSLRAVDYQNLIAMDKTCTAWLGYAIFHPETALPKTSVENLTIRLSATRLSAVHALLAMASGNNLLYGLGHTTTLSTGYYRAKARSGASVTSSPELDTPAVLCTAPSDDWITLCSVPENTEPSVRVVVPGHGIGWVRTTDILEVERCAPAASCVRRLRLILRDRRGGSDFVLHPARDMLLELLPIFGPHLTYLHIDSFGLFDAQTVQSILRLCPNLETLRIAHNGACWADPTYIPFTPDVPRLRELELNVGSTLQPLDAPQLEDLTALRIVSSDYKFPENRDVVHRVLQRYPRVAYFNWHLATAKSYHYVGHIPTYDEQEAFSRSLLALPEALEWARVPLRFDARVALLSVSRHKQSRSSAISCLPPEIWQRIFRMSSSLTRRQLYVRNES